MQVRWFAGAAAAAGTRVDEVQPTSGTVREVLLGLHPDLDELLQRCTFLVDGRRIALDDPWPDAGDHVDVLPPFTGG